MSLPVIHQDEDLVAVVKPSGLLVHRSPLDRSAQEFALQTVRDQLGQRVYPVHRLDRATSGLLIFALHRDAAEALCAQFRASEVAKEYWAVVRGTPPAAVDLDYALREELDRLGDPDARAGKPAQPARTRFTRLATCELPYCVDKFPTARYALVRAEPATGRKHQIRRHLRHLGHPIIGDVTYGVGKHNRFFAQELATRRLLLACVRIDLRHPRTGAALRLRAPLSEDFRVLLHRLGWENWT